ncbi:PhzF family phenazine biosynthesis protein [Peribacillus muralis]
MRWFTPNGKIDFCGHATLATAYVIWAYLDKNVKIINLVQNAGF